MKKSIILIVAFLTICIGGFSQQKYPAPNVGSYVSDFANVIPADQQQVLDAKIRAFKDKTSVEIAIVTITSLGDQEIEEYANGLFHQWGIGKKGLDNGLLILIVPAEHKWRIEVGYGLEGWITDALAFQEGSTNFPPNFREQDYFTGVNLVLDHFMTKLANVSEVGLQAYAAQQKKEHDAKMTNIINCIIFGALFIILLFAIGILYIRTRNKAANIRREKEEAEERIDMLVDKIGKLFIQFCTKNGKVNELAKKIPQAQHLLEHWNMCEDKAKNFQSNAMLTNTSSASLEDKETTLNKILDDFNETIEFYSLFKNADELFAKVDKLKDVEDLVVRGVAIVKGLRNSLSAANDMYTYYIKKFGQDVWNYGNATMRSFNFDALSKNIEDMNLLISTMPFVTMEYFDEVTRRYGEVQNTVSGVTTNINIVKARAKEIDDMVSFVGGAEVAIMSEIEKAKRYLNNSDVYTDSTNKIISTIAEAKNIIAANKSEGLITRYEQFSMVMLNLQKAEKQAQGNIDAEERKRREEEEEEKRREMAAAALLISSQQSSYSTTTTNDDDDDNASFGGGDSGGGGASGSW